MKAPLLTTKLFVPSVQGQLVSRPRLTTRLDEALHQGHKLILISAPAGYGKSTLVSEWVHLSAGKGLPVRDQVGIPPGQTELLPSPWVAWLSLDEADNDPVTCCGYVAAALRTIDRTIGKTAGAALDTAASRMPPLNTFLTGLLNEVNDLPNRIVLVVDNYQVIRRRVIHSAFNFLLERLPSNMSLIIITRADPPLSLTRMQAGHQISSIRAQDLRFRLNEVHQFFEQMTASSLNPAQVAALEQHTEGWIAGLQLATLSIKETSNPSRFITRFNGADRLVKDYFIKEVFEAQPRSAQTFLLETSILQRFNADLVETITGQSNSHAVLAQLLESNAFIMPVENHQGWYRYHRLFREFLQDQLQAGRPNRSLKDIVPVLELHRRAAGWYQQRGLVEEALFHFLAAGAVEAAGQLVEAHVLAIIKQGEVKLAQHWLDALPAEVVQANSRLCLAYVWVYHIFGFPQKLAAAIARARAALDREAAGHLRHNWQAELAAHESYLLFAQGNLTAAFDRCQELLNQIKNDNHLARVVVYFTLLRITNRRGNIAQATHFSQAVITYAQEAGLTVYQFLTAQELASLQILKGDRQAAAATFQQILRLLSEPGREAVPCISSVHLSYGRFLYQINHLAQAETHIRRGLSLSQQHGQPFQEVEGRLLLRRWQWAMEMHKAKRTQKRFEPPDSSAQFEAIERLWIKIAAADYCPDDIFCLNLKRIDQWLREGDLIRAKQAIQALGIDLGDEPTSRQDLAYLALVRLYLAEERQLPAVTALLERLHALAAESGAVLRVMEIMILQALVHVKLGRSPTARSTLQKALTLAEWTGFERLFLDEQQPMIALLRQTNHPYRQTLLASMPPGQPDEVLLVEALTDRELEVLRLYAAGLNRAEIAQQLFISKNGIKWHLKNIYSKLGVNRRAGAINKARQLGLLT